MNLLNAVRTAASPAARGRGVLVLLNDEIHAAREVTKTSTVCLQTFRTPDFGVLGQADGDRIVFYHRSERRCAADTAFDVRMLTALPRVDIVYSYIGSDGAAVRAFIAAGFAPGFDGAADSAALREAVAAGIVVVQSSRAGSGRIFYTSRLREWGFLSADNLNPQKARLLLALALSVTQDGDEIARLFDTH